MIHYIYKITNIETSQFYIGVRSFKDIDSDKYMGSSSIWDRKYIKENFKKLKKEILFCNFTSRDEANLKEIEVIKEVISDELCVNILEGKIPSHLGKKHSQEFINKRISAWSKPPFKGKHHTEESKKKISEKLKGIPNSELQKQITSKRLLGVPKSKEQKDKISKTKKERIENGLIKKTYKKLYVFDLLKNEKTSYEGCKVFADKFGYPYGSVKFYARKNKLYLSRYILTYTAFISDDDRKLGELLGSPEVDNQQPSSNLNG